MVQVELVRLTQHEEAPQFGALLFDGLVKMLTLEPPDFHNTPSVSCIPLGTYMCRRRKSDKVAGNYTFEVMDVPNRTGILFHWGNTAADTRGCILVGMELGTIKMVPGILRSRRAFQLFSALLKEENEMQLFVTHASL